MPRKIVPVLLAGGKGERLRPLTSKKKPKPLLKPFSEYSLFQETALRVKSDEFEAPYVVTQVTLAKELQEELAQIDMSDASILAEPMMKSTAGSVAAAAFTLAQKDVLMAVMPCDHYIPHVKAFQHALKEAASLAEARPVILGVKPQGEESRYGFIQAKGIEGQTYRSVVGFEEKPRAGLAKIYARNPNMYWNTGIFVCKPEALLDLLHLYEPNIYSAVNFAVRDVLEQGAIKKLGPSYFDVPEKTIDHAIMEKLEKALLWPYQSAWYDVGSLGTYAYLSAKAKLDAATTSLFGKG